jgi:hypothetical protein
MKASVVLRLSTLVFSLCSLSGCKEESYDYYGPGHTFSLDASCFRYGDSGSISSIDFELDSIKSEALPETSRTYLVFDVSVHVDPNKQTNEEYPSSLTDLPGLNIRSNQLSSIDIDDTDSATIIQVGDGPFGFYFKEREKRFQARFCYECQSISGVAFCLRDLGKDNPFGSVIRYIQVLWKP